MRAFLNVIVIRNFYSATTRKPIQVDCGSVPLFEISSPLIQHYLQRDLSSFIYKLLKTSLLDQAPGWERLWIGTCILKRHDINSIDGLAVIMLMKIDTNISVTKEREDH